MEFEHWIHSFLKVKKDGSTMTFSHVGSPVFLRFRRDSGREERCQLLMDVPRARWSEPHLAELTRRMESLDVSPVAPAGEIGVLLRVILEIGDIWEPASGARGSRLAQELFAILGLGQEARFNVSMKGENSLRTWRPTAQRWQKGESTVLRGLGERIEDEAGKETESPESAKARYLE